MTDTFDVNNTGNSGTVNYLGFGTVINRYSSGGGMKAVGFLDSGDMQIADDGSFEIIEPGNTGQGPAGRCEVRKEYHRFVRGLGRGFSCYDQRRGRSGSSVLSGDRRRPEYLLLSQQLAACR